MPSEAGTYPRDGEDGSLLHDLDLLARGLLLVTRSGALKQNRKVQAGILIGTVAVCRIGASRYIVACNGVEDATYTVQASVFPSIQDIGQRATETADPGFRAPKEADLDKVVSLKRDNLYVITQKDGRGDLQQRFYQVQRYDFDPKDQIAPFLRRMLAEANRPIPVPNNIAVLSPLAAFGSHAEMRIVAYCEREKLSPTFIGVSKPCCETCANELDRRGIGYTRWAPLGTQRNAWVAPGNIADTIVSQN